MNDLANLSLEELLLCSYERALKYAHVSEEVKASHIKETKKFLNNNPVA